MSRAVVLGAGVMGTAFTFPLCDAGAAVDLVGTHLDESEVASIASRRRHPRLPFDVPEALTPLPRDKLPSALSQKTDLLVVGVSSPGVAWAAKQISGTYAAVGRGPLPPILMLTKGLSVEGREITILPERLKSLLRLNGVDPPAIGAIGGPCIASELAQRRQTSVVVSGPDKAFLDGVRDLLSTSYYQLQPATDLIGVEACAALKNFYTIAVAAGASHNPAAAVFARALGEMARITRALGGREETSYGLAGAGDLYVTCQAGRNSRLGGYLGKGMRCSQVRENDMKDETIEGADLAMILAPLLLEEQPHDPNNGRCSATLLSGLRLPVARALARAVYNDELLSIPGEP